MASRHPAPTTAGDIEDPDPSRGSRSRSNGRSTITILNTEPRLTWTDDFARVVRAHVDGYASDEDVARLKAEPEDWVEVLVDLRHRARTALDHVHSTVHGPERELVLEDFQSDYDRIEGVLQHQLALGTVDRAVDVVEGGPGPVPEIDEDLHPVLGFCLQACQVLVGRVAVDVGPDDASEVVGPGQAGLGVQDRDR